MFMKKFNNFGCLLKFVYKNFVLSCYHFVMKMLKDYEKELSKCSKCGQCQVACPVYKLTKNDCTVSRGKFIMLHGVTQGELKLTKNINKYLDMCLKCGKCSDFCPAGIDALEIITCAKQEYMKTTIISKIINFFQSKLVFSNFIKIGKLIFRHSEQGILRNKTLGMTECEESPYITKENCLSVMYFKGCVNKVLPDTDKYLKKIFEKSDIEIIAPDFDCCGLPFLSEGNMDRFEQSAKTNIENLNTSYDYLVTDCASCESTLLSYKKYFDCNITSEKLLNWGDIIALKDLKFEFKHPVKVTFHKPCHLKNDSFFEKIIKNCTNVEYIKMDNYDECCGFAGSFALKNRGLSKELSKNKAINIRNTDADYVITSCPACILGLKQGLFLTGNKKTKVVSLLEFLALPERIY